MKCPHCGKENQSPVLETRKLDGSIYRKRSCGACSMSFVSREYADANLKLPRPKRTPEQHAREIAAQRKGVPAGIRGDGLDLARIWRL